MSRADLIRYFEGRADLPRTKRKAIVAKIREASDRSIATDRPCEGKHWFVMDFEGRNVCPYCEWRLTRPAHHQPEGQAPE